MTDAERCALEGVPEKVTDAGALAQLHALQRSSQRSSRGPRVDVAGLTTTDSSIVRKTA